jgi:hypothetical protein
MQLESSNEVDIDENFEHDANNNVKRRLADDIVYNYIKGGSDEIEQLQHLQNSRSKYKKDALGDDFGRTFCPSEFYTFIIGIGVYSSSHEGCCVRILQTTPLPNSIFCQL